MLLFSPESYSYGNKILLYPGTVNRGVFISTITNSPLIIQIKTPLFTVPIQSTVFHSRSYKLAD